MSKSFASWLMTVGLLVSVVAGVGYLAQPVALPHTVRHRRAARNLHGLWSILARWR
jgi:hypothetical protein